jgi:hypothetical protein
MPESQLPIVASFGITELGRQKAIPRRSKATNVTDLFADLEVFQYAPVEAATELIRKDIKWYIAGSYLRATNVCFTSAGMDVGEAVLWPASSPISDQLETAIAESRKILEIEIDPDAGIDAQYTEDTWKRSTKLLQQLAERFWDDNGIFLPIPSIAPALAGSIDLFWELKDQTLLINIPADPASNATFYGRRRPDSKISGSLAVDDVRLRHLTGWLSGRE